MSSFASLYAFSRLHGYKNLVTKVKTNLSLNMYGLNIHLGKPQKKAAIKLEGGGGLGLNGPANKRRTFFLRLPLAN